MQRGIRLVSLGLPRGAERDETEAGRVTGRERESKPVAGDYNTINIIIYYGVIAVLLLHATFARVAIPLRLGLLTSRLVSLITLGV
jgi:hypothetical protein